ncbi:zf-CCHC domain-containing protein/UBN2 domain-containing protein [Cephalotus follicularis]|uniref:Zf-CCHC domain-containing protein/UBN2 domain-containing protein n=1 Tax=Cephalotus follicularis TaxID=3775 RepID=A0A1Q3BPI7_CEPFO|nr:zf-CCHC domain-containing protein/UBN2 domain-containing protein [Cephalotus follicularis]
MFIMHENEDIKTMFTRFTNITNALQALDKVYTNSEMVRKILRCLPRVWMPKVTAIEEAKDLNTLPLEGILRSLMTHELSIKKNDDDEEKEKRNKKVVALKSSINEESEDDSDEELALITRKFKRFLTNKKKFGGKPYKKTHPQKRETSKLEEIICYECNKSGHFKSDCLMLKKKRQIKKEKVLLSIWEDSNDSSSDEETQEEVAQLALMAIEEEEDNVEISYDEFIVIVKIYSSIISSLKKKVKSLTNENVMLRMATPTMINQDESKEEKMCLLENENLKIEIDT